MNISKLNKCILNICHYLYNTNDIMKEFYYNYWKSYYNNILNSNINSNINSNYFRCFFDTLNVLIIEDLLYKYIKKICVIDNDHKYYIFYFNQLNSIINELNNNEALNIICYLQEFSEYKY